MMKIIDFLFFRKRNIVNVKFFVISYIMSVLFVSIVIIIIVGILNYLNGKGFHYNNGFIEKTFKMISIAGFFAILYNVFTIFSDKIKIRKLILQFKQEYNDDCLIEYSLVKIMNEKKISNTPEKTKLKRKYDGKLNSLDIHSITATVMGINIKRMEYRTLCTFLYSSGKNEKVIFEFYTINNVDLKLQNIIYSLEVDEMATG